MRAQPNRTPTHSLTHEYRALALSIDTNIVVAKIEAAIKVENGEFVMAHFTPRVIFLAGEGVLVIAYVHFCTAH